MPLHPDAEAYLELQRDKPPRSSLTIEQTRQMYLGMRDLAGPPPPLPRVEDLTIAGDLRVRQYWPDPQQDLALVLFFHGGRFISGDLDTHDTVCRSLALTSNCRVAAIDYRLAPEHRFPAAYDDVCRAVEWARSQEKPFAVAGDSVGGNLAAGAAQFARDVISGQLLFYPMLDPGCGLPSHRKFASGFGPGTTDMLRGWREYAGSEQLPFDPRFAPLYSENLSGLPPALIISAEYDCLRDEAELYAQQIALAGTRVRLKRYRGMIHAFAQMSGILVDGAEAIAEGGAFLRNTLYEQAG